MPHAFFYRLKATYPQVPELPFGKLVERLLTLLKRSKKDAVASPALVHWLTTTGTD
jgi:hypothetical protein